MITWTPKHTFKITLAFALVVLIGGVAAYFFLKNIPETEIEIKRVEEPLSEDGKPVLGLTTNKFGEIVVESKVFKAQMRFNAIALNWKEERIVPEDLRQVYLRTSLDGEKWGKWMELESLGPLREDDPRPDRALPEVPLLVNGEFFQYKVVVKDAKAKNVSPYLHDLWVTYIDSRTPTLRKIIGSLKRIFPFAEAASEGPSIISRAGWGSPDPYGNLFKGTTRYWDPAYYPVKQIFLHHTVFNNTSDPAAAVRAVWEYHTYTRGWGDIGYNYLIDQQGRVYEGRFGGDNVTAGHVYTFNNRSLGVAVLGCFQSNNSACAGAPPPSPTMINSLTTFLAWKSTNYEIDPTATHTFCGTSSCKTLKTIASHRDANATACPGNLIYDKMSTIRTQTAGKKGGWEYSAKQLTLAPAVIPSYNTDQPVTLSFKNTGNATWSNTTNQLLLKTANPNNRTSNFQGTGWINSQTPAALNEAAVAPGATGTFTFNLKTTLPTNRRYSPETFRLVLEDGSGTSQMFSVIVQPPVDTLADIAAFYDYGNCETRIHAFNSTGNGLSYQGGTGWWSSTDYCASKIIHAVSGDFDGDGVSDIAALYDYGSDETRIHVFKSNGAGFEEPNLAGWWAATDYTATQVKYALAGDFNKDGKSDLAALYDYGSGKMRVHVWLSNGTSFAYQGSQGWWGVDRGYTLSRTTGATAGDFNRDGRIDLATFYDYGSGAARIHVWLSNGSSFKYQGSNGWWRIDRGYHLSRTTGTTSGNFNGNLYTDLATFYDYGSGAARIHVWLSNGSSFKYQGSNGWWRIDRGYSVGRVPFTIASFYSPAYENIWGDIAAVYDYSGNETRIHTFLSTGTRFKYQGPGGWWKSTNYNTSGIKKIVPGHFGR